MEISRRLIVGYGDIIYLSNSEKRLYVGIMGLCGKRVGKKMIKSICPSHNLSSNLLVTAQRAAVIALYRKTCIVCDHPGGGSCSA